MKDFDAIEYFEQRASNDRVDLPDDRFDAAIAAFDRANAEDPNQETIEGQTHSAALVYARRMSAWLDRIEPSASSELRLAARCQHIRRWMIPRDSYPLTRAGYHKWRTDLGRFHAEQAGEILKDIGYDSATIERVQSLVRKERLKADVETQTLEDVICLVFLDSYFADFAAKHDDEKVIGILRKTWKKMSDRGHAEALKLPLSDAARVLVARALSG